MSQRLRRRDCHSRGGRVRPRRGELKLCRHTCRITVQVDEPRRLHTKALQVLHQDQQEGLFVGRGAELTSQSRQRAHSRYCGVHGRTLVS